jgi:hypothetical protein
VKGRVLELPASPRAAQAGEDNLSEVISAVARGQDREQQQAEA